MKRTWKEVVDLIKQKKQNAYDHLNHQTDLEATTGNINVLLKAQLIEDIKVYDDLLALIKSSGLMED